jgi:arylsulfatase A-like enzyme
MAVTRRRFLQAAAAGAGAAVLPGLGGALQAAAGSGERPNILWFRSEDNSAEFIGAYGNPLMSTPAIDRLAREGVLYRNFFSTSPVCAPTKLGILTGLHDASLGPGHNMRALGKVPPGLPGFASYLQRLGYWTSESGNPDHNTDLADTGYDDTSGDWRNRPAGSPFFVLKGSITSHETSSFAPLPGATDPADVRLPRYHPDHEILRRDRAHYMDAVTRMDEELAAERAKLEEDGLLEDTIVIYSSDHGGVLPRSKRFCYHSGLHTPLIVRFPERWQHLAPSAPGTQYREPVSTVDAPPTILSLAGAAIPSYMHGQPFAGPRIRRRTYAFSNRNRMDESIDFVRTVSDGRYRYIRNYMPHLPYGQHCWFMWLQAGVREWERAFLAGELDEVQSRFWKPKPSEELYDLERDPDEVDNLAGSRAHQAKLDELRRALDEHMLRIHDNGFIPEGMAAEGWVASRQPGAYPLRRLLDLGRLCIARNPRNVMALTAALRDRNEIIRFWAAMGLSMLDAAAAPATLALAAAMQDDASLWVRVQAADALTRADLLEPAVTFLGDVVADRALPMSARLQSACSLARLGTRAAAALPQLTAAAPPGASSFDDYAANGARYAARVVSGTYVPSP